MGKDEKHSGGYMSIIENDGRFERFFALLTEWNARHNLTAITDRAAVYTKHFLDSILAESLLKQGARVLDVGSGAGFPGIPLKLVRDDLTLSLLDSNNKKVAFMAEAIAQLGLVGISARHTRVESLAERGVYDHAVSRAVASISVLAEYCLPFVRVGGTAILYKSDKVGAELDAAAHAIRVLGGRLGEVREVELGAGIVRALVVVEKVADSPLKYPRSGNKPRLDPL